MIKHYKLKETFRNFQKFTKINIFPEKKRYYIDDLGNVFFDKNSFYLNKLSYPEYNDFDYTAADFFSKKIDIFLEIFNSSKIFLVFPCILVKSTDLEKWNNYLNDFKEFMKKQKVKTLFYDKIFYTEKERYLFLDTFSHPNNVIRDKNSLEINNFVFKNN